MRRRSAQNRQSISPGGPAGRRSGMLPSKRAGSNAIQRVFFPTKLFEHLPRSQCKLRTKAAYGVLAKRQPARGARYREVQHVAQWERVWRTRQRRHGPDSTRGAGDGSLQGNRQHTPPAARPALGCSGTQGWWGACGGTAGTRRFSGPDFCSEDYKSLRERRGGSAQLGKYSRAADGVVSTSPI